MVVEELAAMLVAELPGPEESPPQESCNANSPTASSEGATSRKSFMVVNIREREVAPLRSKPKAKTNYRKLLGYAVHRP